MTNASLRRQVNEYIYETLLRFDAEPRGLMNAVCECDESCSRVGEIELETYQRVRSAAGERIVSADHDRKLLGEVVKHGSRYRVVGPPVRQPGS